MLFFTYVPFKKTLLRDMSTHSSLLIINYHIAQSGVWKFDPYEITHAKMGSKQRAKWESHMNNCDHTRIILLELPKSLIFWIMNCNCTHYCSSSSMSHERFRSYLTDRDQVAKCKQNSKSPR